MLKHGAKSTAPLEVPLCKPDVGKLELDAIQAVFETGQLSHGPKVRAFEAEFEDLVGGGHAVALNSCTSGLYLACLWVREHRGKGEIVLPSFTFVASANAVCCAGMEPRFADVEWESGNVSAATLEPAINERTRAIMPVHYAGRPCPMREITALAAARDLIVIEDCAECLGAEVGGRSVGSFGIGVFSFYSTKNITTGEGGMLTTDNAEIADWVRLRIAHGVRKGSYSRDGIAQKWYRNAVVPGQNFRLSNFQAAMGLVQLQRLEEMRERRHQVASQYCAGLAGCEGIELPIIPDKTQHSWQMFTIRVSPAQRDSLVLALNEQGIGASVHFDPPVHLQSAYAVDEFHLPTTERLAQASITLPISSVQTLDETEHVIACLKACLRAGHE